ncbi:MAG: site-specific integrase, partial [Oscillospiraceae bacterium]|nr:site-specific integrase [Oscillospiraceae bacterium]
MTVYYLFQEWIQAISSRVKESTIANYRMKAEKHIFPEFGDMDCCEINTSIIHEFIAEKIRSGLSARYVSDIVVLLKSVFKYASRIYQLYNPLADVIMPKKKQSEITLLNSEQQEQLKIHLYRLKNHTALGVALCLYTGLRIGELCALRWKDIDLKKRVLTVNHTVQRIRAVNSNRKTKLVITEPKSVTSQRTIPIPECILDLLKRFLSSDPEAFVLSGTRRIIEPRTMQYRFAALLKSV